MSYETPFPLLFFTSVRQQDWVGLRLTEPKSIETKWVGFVNCDGSGETQPVPFIFYDSISHLPCHSGTLSLSLSLSLSSKALWSFSSHGHRRYCQPLPGPPLVASLFLSLPSPLFSTFTILPHPSSYLNWVTIGFALSLIVLLMTGKSNKGAHYCKIFKKGPAPA